MFNFFSILVIFFPLLIYWCQIFRVKILPNEKNTQQQKNVTYKRKNDETHRKGKQKEKTVEKTERERHSKIKKENKNQRKRKFILI